MAENSSYLEEVMENRRRNLEILQSLGLSKGPQKEKEKTERKPVKQIKRAPLRPKAVPQRRSIRLLEKETKSYSLSDVENDDFTEERLPDPEPLVVKEKVSRPNTFGAIPGVAVGTVFLTRLDASHAGIHRPTVAGIHGNPELGCYSLALSGGYEDDCDEGEKFIYTGEGGRDLKGTKTNPKNLRTAPQSKDQKLERGNLALTKNIERNVPVRVLRGYKLQSEFAPLEGYRYDGLYNVTDYYKVRGKSGYSVFKFVMERVENQEPAPWSQ